MLVKEDLEVSRNITMELLSQYISSSSQSESPDYELQPVLNNQVQCKLHVHYIPSLRNKFGLRNLFKRTNLSVNKVTRT